MEIKGQLNATQGNSHFTTIYKPDSNEYSKHSENVDDSKWDDINNKAVDSNEAILH